MAGNPEFLVEALKNTNLTPEQWGAISDACDQCLMIIGNPPSPSPRSLTFKMISTPSNVEHSMYSHPGSTVAISSVPQLSSSIPVILDLVAYDTLKRKLQEIQETANKESIPFPHLDRAMKAYTSGRRDSASSASKAGVDWEGINRDCFNFCISLASFIVNTETSRSSAWVTATQSISVDAMNAPPPFLLAAGYRCCARKEVDVVGRRAEARAMPNLVPKYAETATPQATPMTIAALQPLLQF
ncbi:uncharacterized protein EV420DRAFT_1708649 [Desarmillaria tabescens]|uniref:Uncharacterized protein n=1 Tax=Armillaria tabescens TaxID=1929756 RepID=A0AA39MWE7_ARMTA|nr:uncharacterized protein EV420DRAFT_1708649 [Desarmillaria tabescens]KAK0449087.1 hypothetical protein EV420DRAFT_1708649 [Desarmillaria tabescens]